PEALCACVVGGSKAMGIFAAFLPDEDVSIFGFEAGGEGIESGRHAARFSGGRPGVLHGSATYILQDEDGQTRPSHSVSAGLDYPSVGPEHSHLHDTGRVVYEPVMDDEAMTALQLLARTEGIIPAIESADALAGAMRVGERLGPEAIILVNLSGRGDKDMTTAATWFDYFDEGAVQV
ncbi:tryptophan synthase subunit beta, partial [Burkholderia multivorans]